MKTVQELSDTAIAKNGWWSPDYLELATIGGETVIDAANMGSYQGDSIALLYDPATNLYAFVEWGYGSCSGCDTLEAASGNISEIQEIADSLHPTGPEWKNAAAMACWIKDRDWADHYYGKDPECVQFVARVLTYLADQAFSA